MSSFKGASVPDQALAVPVEPASGLAPSGFDPSRIARKLTEKQFEALSLSGEGWPLSFYFMPGRDHPGDRGSVYGQPYWSWRKGVPADDTPKKPHWRVAVSLQDMGLISQGTELERITDLGREVLAIAIEARRAGTPKSDPVHESAGRQASPNLSSEQSQ